MIQKVTNTSGLYDTYFEDINATVNTKKECYWINILYFYDFSTLRAAKGYAKKRGISQRIAKAN